MILSIAGTTQFDELAEAVDRIALRLPERVIIQIGYNSKYIPRNCEYFNFAHDIKAYINEARIVIAHGGAGITFDVLEMNKLLISVENPHVLDLHQKDLLRKLSDEKYIIWCRDLNNLEKCIEEASERKIEIYRKPECGIGDVIIDLL